MITLQRNKQKMYYSLQDKVVPIYETNDDGEIQYYIDSDGNKIPLTTGDEKVVFSEPVEFWANINNKLDEVLIKEFGIDDSTKYAQIVYAKNKLPLTIGSVIWKKSEILYDGEYVDDKSSDYTVLGIADEGLNVDLFLLQKNV